MNSFVGKNSRRRLVEYEILKGGARIDAITKEKIDNSKTHRHASIYALPCLISNIQSAEKCLNDTERVAKILKIVCDFFDTTLDEVKTKTRKREIVWVRQLCITLIYETTNYSLKNIGSIFGIDHTTVIHSKDKVSGICQVDVQKREIFNHLLFLVK